MSEYLHNKGTDKLIADVMAFDPTKVNPAEQDEIDTAPILNNLSESYKNGARDGARDAINQIWARREAFGLSLEQIEEMTKIVDAELFRMYGAKYSLRPAGSTR